MVNLAADIAAVLPELRRQAEARMTATCTVSHGGTSTWNPETLQYDTDSTAVYTGRCRVRPAVNQDRGNDAADQALIESQFILSLPVVGSGAIKAGDMVVITSCPEDAAMTGRTYSIIAMPAYSQGTARRIPVREVQ